MGEGKFLSHALALAIGGDRFTCVRLFLPASIPARTCGRLAGEVDEFQGAGVLFEAGLDEVIGSVAVDLEIGFVFSGLCHSCQVKHVVHTFHSLPQRGLVAAISCHPLNGEAHQPLLIARFPHEATDVDSLFD